MSDVKRYLDIVTSEHRQQPKYIAWLTAGLNPIDDITTCLKTYDALFDLDSAIGYQLDTVGLIAGVGRVLSFQPSDESDPVADDDTYRLMIRAKIAQNQWDGTIDGLFALWALLFPTITLALHDNQDMSATVFITGTLTALQQELITNGYMIPKPAGVSYTYAFSSTYVFGYDLENATFRGYDEGYWANLL